MKPGVQPLIAVFLYRCEQKTAVASGYAPAYIPVVEDRKAALEREHLRLLTEEQARIARFEAELKARQKAVRCTVTDALRCLPVSLDFIAFWRSRSR